MKKIMSVLAVAMISVVAMGQTMKESENAYEAQYISDDNSTIVLEQQYSNSSFSESVKGTEYKLRVDEPTSTVTVNAGKAKFLVNLSHNTNVNEGIKLVKMTAEKKKRSTRTFIAVPLNKNGDETPELVKFTTEKYGEHSYIVTVENLEVGEYAFAVGGADFVKNNGVNGKAVNFQLFSVK